MPAQRSCHRLCHNPSFCCYWRGFSWRHALPPCGRASNAPACDGLNVPGDGHDRRVRRAALCKLCDGTMPQIVEPETGKSCFLRQRAPCGSPALYVSRGVKACDIVANDLAAAKSELRNEGREDIMRWFYGAEGSPPASAAVPEPKAQHLPRAPGRSGPSLWLELPSSPLCRGIAGTAARSLRSDSATSYRAL